MIIGGVVVVIIIIIAVVLGVTLSKPAPKLQKTVGTEIPDQSLSAKVKSDFWGVNLDLTCPRGEHITHLHGHKYLALINGLAATCSGGSQVGDQKILDLLSKKPNLIQNIASKEGGSHTIYFQMAYIYDPAITKYQFPQGVSFNKLKTPDPPDSILTTPAEGLIGTYGSIMETVTSTNNKPISRLTGELGTSQYTGKACICDKNGSDPLCLGVPTVTTMMCHSTPRCSSISVYA